MRLIASATNLLDAETDISRITVTQVVTKAGLTRPTFYASFDGLPEVFAAAALHRLREAFEGLGVDPNVTPGARSDAMLTAFTAILNRLAAHAEFFSRVLGGPGGPIVQQRIIGFIADRVRVSSPVSGALASGRLPVDLASQAIAAGVVWIMIRWLDDQPRRPMPEIAAILRDFVESSVLGGLGGRKGATP